jgi:hypothetical protein
VYIHLAYIDKALFLYLYMRTYTHMHMHEPLPQLKKNQKNKKNNNNDAQDHNNKFIADGDTGPGTYTRRTPVVSEAPAVEQQDEP